MIPFNNALSIAPGDDAKTYADFLTWANAQPGYVNAQPGWNIYNLGAQGGDKARFTLGSTFSGTSYGSPWRPVSGTPYGLFEGSSNLSRLVQHCFVSESDALANLNKIVLFQATYNGPDSSMGSLNRNGYTSLAIPYDPDEGMSGYISRRFDYFNQSTGKRVQVDPFTRTVQEFDLP